MIFRIKNDYLKEVVQFYTVFLIVVFAVYKLPFPIASVIQFIILIVFYRSEKSYFWLAFVFLVEANPGALFSIVDVPNTLSLLPNSPVGVLFFWMIFLVVAYAKAYNISLKKPFFLNSIITVLLIYMVFSLLAFGFQKATFIKGWLPWLTLFIIPRLMKKENDYERFFNLIFSFVFFVFVSQLIFLVTATEFSTYLGGSNALTTRWSQTIEQADQALRPISGITIPFLAITGSVTFIAYKRSQFSNNYLYLILGLSLLSIFITATRGWILGAVLIFLVFSFVVLKNPFSLLPKIILPGIVLILLFNFVPFLKKQADLSLDRFETLSALIGGDKTAGGSLSRLDERGPRVMKKFWESPVLGWGGSKTGVEFSDGHVGNQNLLMRYGIVGFSLMILFWLAFIIKLLFINKTLTNKNPYKNLPLLFISFMLSMILIHSSSSQWFAFGFGFTRGFVLFFVLSFANFVYWEAQIEERKIWLSK